MSEAVTSYDVARVAGVSQTAVSFVITGKADRYGAEGQATCSRCRWRQVAAETSSAAD